MANDQTSTNACASAFRASLTSDAVAVLFTGAWLFALRIMLGVSWGFAATPATEGLVDSGILCNPGDTWSYLSWVQQYSHGQNLASLVYTTEPHSALLWIFPLWLVGKVAALTGLPALGVYNTTGVIGAMVAVFCFRRAAAALRLPSSARDWATVAFVLGSGGSWLWHLAHKLGWASPANGGDLFFLDLFPATTLFAYAYQAIGLALLTALWWTTTELENRLNGNDSAFKWFVFTFATALLLGFSRPYEPAAFFGAWLLKTSWHWLRRQSDPVAWQSAAIVAVVLALALAPGIGRSIWIAKQPVWSTFASASMTLGLSRQSWLWTLSGWILLAALGVGAALRGGARQAVLPITSSLLLGVILLGLGSSHNKLASGLMLGPILLGGYAAAEVVAVTRRLPVFLRVGLGSFVLSTLFGIGSLFLALNATKLQGPHLIDAELVSLARQLPVGYGQPPPVVLTDTTTGNLLPGLVGVRVWVGHWSLSPHYKSKAALLQRAGLDPEKTTPGDTVDSSTEFAALLVDTHFDYALLDRRCGLALTGLVTRGWQPLATTTHWSLLKAPAQTL